MRTADNGPPDHTGTPERVQRSESPKIRTPERVQRSESPKIRTPERVPDHTGTPGRESPKIRTPERVPDHTGTPGRESPKIRTPERESPKIQTPERVQRRESPKIRTPERVPDHTGTPGRESPKIRTPERESPKIRTPERESPKIQRIAILLHKSAILLHAQSRTTADNCDTITQNRHTITQTKGAKMPYKSDKCIIQGTKYDRRRKLTTAQRDQIAATVGVSSREIARRFGISRRLVQFIQHPERLKTRQKRGGSKIYYNRADHNKSMKKLRKYIPPKKISLPAKKYLTP